MSLYPSLKFYNQPKIGLEWLFNKTGIGASNHFEAGGFIRGNEDVAYPNLQYHFLPIAIRYDGSAPNEGHGFQLHVGPMNTDVRGHVKIKSTDPGKYPSILFNYLSTEQERKEWIEAIRCTRNLVNQPAFDELRGKELSPGGSVETDEEILDFVAREGESAYHPSCTCKMGYDDESVVDTNLKVHGIENLSVVDASVMPAITNGNIYAPVIMIAEKAADILLGNSPEPAQEVPYYIHSKETEKKTSFPLMNIQPFFIDGSWVTAQAGNQRTIINPFDQQPIALVPEGDRSDARLAIQSAGRAFREQRWSQMPAPERGKMIYELGDLIAANKEELAELETLNTGKTYTESLWDMDDIAGIFRYYGGLVDKQAGEVIASPNPDSHSRLEKEPVGVVGMICPWNYPLLQAAWKIAPALAAGCTLVIKPSELTPLSTLAWTRLAEKVGFPGGVINTVTGPGATVGAELAESHEVDMISFTGGVVTGKKSCRRLQEMLKK